MKKLYNSGATAQSFSRFDTVQIRQQNSIPEYLEKKGYCIRRESDHFSISCIFHEEKTASLKLWDDHFHCFGCDAHGDVIDLDAAIHGDEFSDACRRLAYPIQGSVIIHRPKNTDIFSRTDLRGERLESKAAHAKALLLKKFAWPFTDVWPQSPVPHNLNGWESQWRDFLNIWNKCDIAWIGEITDSGQQQHSKNFRTIAEWQALPGLPASRVAAAAFKANSFARRSEFVRDVPFIVIEADEAIERKPESYDEINANRAANLALLRWLHEGVGLNLKAIIDSGNKSLHGWFDHPGESIVQDIARISKALGIDSLVTKSTQPLRLPGVMHESGARLSNLIWLSKS